MAYYIKANRKVAEAVGNMRQPLADGTYMLWQSDLAKYEGWPNVPAICARIGALALTPAQAREEQLKIGEPRPLPAPEDSEWAVADEPQDEQGEEPKAEEEPAE